MCSAGARLSEMAANVARKKNRHWTREETLNLIAVWGESHYQRQLEDMVHNHTVWENIHRELLLQCPSIQDFGDWTKIKERLDYLRRKYRDCLKNNKRTGSQPIKCPYFEELDAVLGCRPMNNPWEIRMDNGGSSEDEARECSGGSGSTEPLSNTSRKIVAEDDASSEDSMVKASTPKPQAQRQRKGRKTQIMEALEKGLDQLAQNDNTHDYEKERLEWEKEVERNRMELEKKRLDFEMKRMETDDRRAKENRELMLQLFQCFRPPPFHLTWPHITTLIHDLTKAHQLRTWTSAPRHPQPLDPLLQQHIWCTSIMTHPTSFLFVLNHCRKALCSCHVF